MGGAFKPQSAYVARLVAAMRGKRVADLEILTTYRGLLVPGRMEPSGHTFGVPKDDFGDPLPMAMPVVATSTRSFTPACSSSSSTAFDGVCS